MATTTPAQCARCHQAPTNGKPGSGLCTPCATAVMAAPCTPPPATATATCGHTALRALLAAL